MLFYRYEADLWANKVITIKKTQYELIKETEKMYFLKNKEVCFRNVQNRIKKNELNQFKMTTKLIGKQPIRFSCFSTITDEKQIIEIAKKQLYPTIECQFRSVYHISLNVASPIDEFVPRTPSLRFKQEPCVERICVSDSILNCFKAVPWTGHHLKKLLTHTERLGAKGIPFFAYEFDAVKNNSKIINASVFVPDGNITKEHWILERIKPTKVHYCLLNNFKSSIVYPNRGSFLYVTDELDFEYVSKEQIDSLFLDKDWQNIIKIVETKPNEIFQNIH